MYMNVTNNEGKYSMVFAGWTGGPPCWIMTDMYSPVTYEMYSKSFNPRLARGYPYYAQKPHYIPCNINHPLVALRAMSMAAGPSLTGSMAALNYIAAAALSPVFFCRTDYIMDMKILAGKATMNNAHISKDSSQDIYQATTTTSGVMSEGMNAVNRDIYVLAAGAGATTYQTSNPHIQDNRIVQSQYDFDGDGDADKAVIGQFSCRNTADNNISRLVDRHGECTADEERFFVAAGGASIAKSELENAQKPYYQGVYFSSSLGENGEIQSNEPDVVRLLDDMLNDHHQGLVSLISETDLRNTDIYVFRESTGDLLAERSGLAFSDVNQDRQWTDNTSIGTGVDEYTGQSFFHYRMQLRNGNEGYSRVSHRFSRRDENGNFMNASDAFSRWQMLSGMNPKFHERVADHVRPGEPVKIIAINRATGYIGSAKTVLDVKNSIYSVPSIHVPEITMGPPNLKIWAERDMRIEAGMTKTDVGAAAEKYLISSEGGAETDDIMIRVYSEWLDQDGSPLPEQLSDFGYTARLGKINAAGTIVDYRKAEYDQDGDASTTGDRQSVRYFPIKPGKNLQLVRVSEANAGTQHLYVQVNGESFIRNPDFSGDPAVNIELNERENRTNPLTPEEMFEQLGAGPGILASRPKLYVPILTPIWDEDTTLENKLYHKKWEIAQAEIDPDNTSNAVNPYKPESSYKWRYRPEFQFTVYDLKVQEILAQKLAEDGSVDESKNILESEGPLITNSDDLISFIYDLGQEVHSPLGMFSTDKKELVLALGEEEFELSFGSDKTVNISNIEHLASLDVEDFLSMRLYLNNDATNVLWEYAFEYIYIATQHADYDTSADRLYVSADVGTIPLQALVVGYAERDPDVKEELTVYWEVEGTSGAELTVDRESDNDVGSFFNELTLPLYPVKGSVANVSIRLGDQADSIARLQPIEILAGAPADIHLSKDQGSYTSAGGFKTIGLEIEIEDQFGNAVEDGTAVDIQMNAEGFIEDYDDPGAVYEGFTENGFVKARIRGGYTPGNYTFKIKSGDYEESFDYEVHPVTVNILTQLTEVSPLTSHQVDIEVLDHTGAAIPNANIRAWGDGFIVDDSSATTNAAGIATLEVLAGGTVNFEAAIKAQVAFEPAVVRPIAIKPANNQDKFNGRSDNIVIVGDKSVTGTVQFTRYDDSGFNIPYEVSSQTSYTGSDGETLDLQLGDLLRPNLDPIATYRLRELASRTNPDTGEIYQVALDSAGMHDLQVDNVVISPNNSPMANVSASGYFKGNSKVTLENIAKFQPTAPGLTVAFSANAISVGTLVENGPIHVEYYNQAVKVTVTTANGSFSTSSNKLMPGWHNVGVKVVDGALTVRVDDEQLAPIAVNGAFINSATPTIGNGFEGHITNVKFFDYSQLPLITFDDGSISKTLTFLSGALTQSVAVKSTGQLNQVSGGSTKQITVMLNSLNEEQLPIPINLLSTATYTELAGQFLITQYNGNEVPEINMAALNNPSLMQSPLNNSALIPQAYAISFTDIGSGFVSALSTAVSFFLPIEEIKIIYEQVGYAIAGDPNFDPVKLAINTVGILTYLPGIGYLAKPIYKPVKAIFRLGRSKPKAMNAVAGAVMKLVDKVKKSKSIDPVMSLMPFLLIAAEMYWEEPEAINIMFNAIKSDEDLWAWIDFFNIPADWSEADVGIPGLDLASLDTSAVQGSNTMLANIPEIYLPKAHAGKRKRLRWEGGKFAKDLKKSIDDLPPEIRNDPQKISGAIRGIIEGLKDTSFGSLRAVVKDPKFLLFSIAAVFRAGTNNLKEFLKGQGDMRVPPMLLIGMMAFLETEAGKKDANGKPYLSTELQSILTVKYLELFKGIITDTDRKLTTLIEESSEHSFYTLAALNMVDYSPNAAAVINSGGGHGSVFHIMMLAYYHLILQSSYQQSDEYVIKGSEKARWIFSYKDKKNKEEADNVIHKDQFLRDSKAKPFRKDLRFVDIVLAKKGATEYTDEEIWVELKSYKAAYKSVSDKGRTQGHILNELYSGGDNQWTYGSKGIDQKKKKYGLHKQFVVDRIAYANSTRSGQEKDKKGWVRSTQAESGRNGHGKNNHQIMNVTGIKWWFQKFNVEVRNKNKTLVSKDRSPNIDGTLYTGGGIRNRMTKLPRGNQKIASYNMNMANGGNASFVSSQAKSAAYDGSDIIEEASLNNLLINAIESLGIVDEMIPGGQKVFDEIKIVMKDM
ncbi:MAG: carboxypeptidase regulatory-like domain-containing protein [Pseudomonadales bacterium]|nr:carboxypeptidase regulatory-like domain-containing protein [Pseudomonadales bacterium]